MNKCSIQSANELDAWHHSDDPWNYESTPDDRLRKSILLSELPQRNYRNVLDIGCGQGFLTRDLPGVSVTGIDISNEAIHKAKGLQSDRLSFQQASLFDFPGKLDGPFDLVVITGVLYPQYVGRALNLVYHIVDNLLIEGGILVSVHIDSWYRARFPYLMLKEHFYPYREYTHRLEVYVK